MAACCLAWVLLGAPLALAKASPQQPPLVSKPTPGLTSEFLEPNGTDRDLIEYEFSVQGGFIELKVDSFGDNAKAHPYSNLNHGLMISLFLPENLLPTPLGTSVYFQGKYMTFSESIDKRFAAAKFVDLDYGLNLMIGLIDRLRLDVNLGIATNPALIRKSSEEFKIINYPSPTLGTRLNYSFPLSERWSLSLLLTQYYLGSAVAGGAKIKDGLGVGAGFQFNLDLYDEGYAFFGYSGTSESQNSDQATIKRNEDLIFFGMSAELGNTDPT